ALYPVPTSTVHHPNYCPAMLRLKLNCAPRAAAFLIAFQIATHGWAQNEAIDFDHEIVPILKTHCVTCHGGREMEGDFSINSRQDVVESGMVDLTDVKSSRLLEL